MLQVSTFAFNPFQENTYVVYAETGECAIVDPGCSNASEEKALVDFIEANNLKPVHLLNTHCHVDHIFGNDFVHRKYGLLPQYNRLEQIILESAPRFAAMYGINMVPSPSAEVLLDQGDTVTIGNHTLDILFLPGHSPGHIAFYSTEQKFILGGDVLFFMSIGRTDFPNSNHQHLMDSIKKNLFRLDDDYIVYPGHGQTTSLGFEKQNNPFLQ